MFKFVKQTPELICMNGFNVCFKFIILLEIFLHFRELTVKNLNSTIIKSHLVAFLCFLELLFQKEPQFLPWSARQTSLPS